MMKTAAALLLASSLAVIGCGDDGHDHHHDHNSVACMGDEDTQGAVLTGTNMKLVLTTVPTLVDPEMDLDFTVTVTDTSDTPLDGVTVTAEPWQPVHMHGVPITPEVTAGTATGEYDIARVHFLHPGRWELRFSLANGADTDDLSAFICVAGTPPTECAARSARPC